MALAQNRPIHCAPASLRSVDRSLRALRVRTRDIMSGAPQRLPSHAVLRMVSVGRSRAAWHTKNQHGQTHAVLHTLVGVPAFRRHISFNQALSRRCGIRNRMSRVTVRAPASLVAALRRQSDGTQEPINNNPNINRVLQAVQGMNPPCAACTSVSLHPPSRVRCAAARP